MNLIRRLARLLFYFFGGFNLTVHLTRGQARLFGCGSFRVVLDVGLLVSVGFASYRLHDDIIFGFCVGFVLGCFHHHDIVIDSVICRCRIRRFLM